MKRLVLVLAIVLAVALGVMATRGTGDEMYTVRPGDTLAEIAARYGTTVERLVELNRDRYPSLVDHPETIEVGWRLRVPGSGDAAVEAREKAEKVVAYVDALATTAVAEEPTPTATPVPFSDPAQVDAWRKEVIRLANVERAKVGAPPLVEDPRLDEIAEARVRDMVERHYYSHYDPETGEYLAGKMCGTYCAEIGMLHGPVVIPSKAIRGWMGSPGHRAHLLGKQYHRAGAAIAIGTVRRDGRLYRDVAVMVMILQ